jgi:hypothetical protein
MGAVTPATTESIIADQLARELYRDIHYRYLRLIRQDILRRDNVVSERRHTLRRIDRCINKAALAAELGGLRLSHEEKQV